MVISSWSVGELDDEEKYLFVEISEAKDEEGASQHSVDLTRGFGNLGVWFVGGEIMASAPSNRIDCAQQKYREGMHEEALGFCSEAVHCLWIPFSSFRERIARFGVIIIMLLW